MNEHPFAYLKERADVLKCCADPKNLVVQRLRRDLLRAVCTRCGRGHRKFLCEPGSYFAQVVPPRILYGAHGEVLTELEAHPKLLTAGPGIVE